MPSWLEGDYSQALNFVAERAVYARSTGPLVKRADFDWQSLLASPEIQGALLGGATGGVGGAMLSENKLRGGLLGALTGAGLGAGAGHLLKGPADSSSPGERRQHHEALEKSRDARAALGVLGANETGVNQAARGGGDPAATAEKIQEAVPGVAEQAGNIPAAVGAAARQGRPGDALKQLDFPGLKNVLPFSGHFSPGTAATAVGANLAARAGQTGLGVLAGQHRGLTEAGRWVKHLEGLSPRLAGRLQNELAYRAVREGYLHRDPGSHAVLGDWTPTNDTARTITRDTVTADMRHAVSRMRGSLPAERGAPATAAPGRLRGLTGGTLPLLATLAPLLYREWLGSGYRSGQQPAMELAQALQVLGKKP